MSVHIELLNATHTRVAFHAGDGNDDDILELPDGEQALILSEDDVYGIVGTPDEIRAVLTRALDALPSPSSEPLSPGDDDECSDDYMRCSCCGDDVYCLSSRGLCDGCEAAYPAEPINPTDTLAELREALLAPEAGCPDYARAVELFDALDDHLRDGGQLPGDWSSDRSPGRVSPGQTPAL